MAIFAPGWTHETLSENPNEFLEKFFERENEFWLSLHPYLYTHPISQMFDTFFYKGTDKVTLFFITFKHFFLYKYLYLFVHFDHQACFS